MSAAPESTVECTHCQTANPTTARYCMHCAERLPLPIGEFFAGRYTIRNYIGAQGIARRYHVTDTAPSIDRGSRAPTVPLTLVELRSNRGWSPEAEDYYLTQFMNEAAQLSFLQELPAVPILHQGLTERGNRRFFVLAGVPQITLQATLEKRQRPFPPDVVIDWGIRLCDLLARLHAQTPPVLLTNLRPGNIGVIGPTVRIFDLDITRHVRTDGLPAIPKDDGFTAPEQLAGLVEPRSALYSLAAIMANLLTNQPPPAASPDSNALNRINVRVPEWLSHLIAINMSAAPYDRYARAEDMAADLRRQHVTDAIPCRACGAENPRTEIYCQECARALLISMQECEVCTQEMPINARFCPNCGIKVS